jgi:hypothetical protein
MAETAVLQCPIYGCSKAYPHLHSVPERIRAAAMMLNDLIDEGVREEGLRVDVSLESAYQWASLDAPTYHVEVTLYRRVD